MKPYNFSNVARSAEHANASHAPQYSMRAPQQQKQRIQWSLQSRHVCSSLVYAHTRAKVADPEEMRQSRCASRMRWPCAGNCVFAVHIQRRLLQGALLQARNKNSALILPFVANEFLALTPKPFLICPSAAVAVVCRLAVIAVVKLNQP